MRTRVGIVGAGPAGLMLSHLLHLRGIESVVLEARTREYVEQRIRAGVLEQCTVDLLNQTGVGARLRREGLVHRGIYLRFGGRRHHVDFHDLTGGRTITVYAQHEVVKDLIQARLDADGQIVFKAEDVTPRNFDTASPSLEFLKDGEPCELACDFIAGCDGFHGVCRPSIPPEALQLFERVYPYAWLGILAKAAPASEELVYSHHDRGFALFSMRSPEITRLYLQCAPDEDLDQWPDARIWDELHTRLATLDGWKPNSGPILQKGVTGMRAFVCEPMRYGRLFLAGDAAHIVPPTGAKGLNLAIADVHRLSGALARFYDSGSEEQLDGYSAACLRRVWKVQRFSAWMTALLHRPPGDDGFELRRQLAELDYLTGSRDALAGLAENYVGLPFD